MEGTSADFVDVSFGRISRLRSPPNRRITDGNQEASATKALNAGEQNETFSVEEEEEEEEEELEGSGELDYDLGGNHPVLEEGNRENCANFHWASGG